MPILPKCVQFSNFAHFWKAEIILHWSYCNHFILNHCLRVANLISSFALPQKRRYIFQVILFCGNVLAYYREREILEIYMFSFGVMQKFEKLRSNSRPLNSDLEKNAFNNFNPEWSQLFKTVRNLKIGHILAHWATLIHTYLSWVGYRSSHKKVVCNML